MRDLLALAAAVADSLGSLLALVGWSLALAVAQVALLVRICAILADIRNRV